MDYLLLAGSTVRPLSRSKHARTYSWLCYFAFIFFFCFTACSLASGADRKRHSGLLQEDFPFQGACISANFPAKNVALKGLAIRVAPDANVLFDTELLRM